MTNSQTTRSDAGAASSSEPRPSTSPSPTDKAAAEPAQANATRAQSTGRRYRWKWNGRLILGTGVVMLVVLAAAMGSYYYHSATTASTFLELANAADQNDDFEDQAKWLQRYALLVPDDVDAIYQMAIAADKAADAADMDSRGLRIDAARRALSRAIGQIGDKDAEKVADLRARMLNRLVQLGGPWNREAERQIVELDADENDPQAMAWLALALAGEIADGSYAIRAPLANAKVDGYWAWLANQSPTFVLGSALRQNPRNLDLITQFLFTRRENPELFRGPRGGATLPEQELTAIEKRAVKTLSETPTSHAQLVYYRYLQNNGEVNEANAVIDSAAELAHQRLLETPSAETLEKPGEGEAAQNAGSTLVTSNPMPVAYWDFLTVYDAARLKTETDVEHALDRLQFLSTLDIPSVPRQLLENLYFEYGKLLVRQDRVDEALTVWNEAIQSVDPNSILLPRAIASVQASQGNWKAAEQATQQLADAIDASEKQLARMTDAQIARSERIVQGRRLAAARWQLEVLKSYLAAAQGDEIAAIRSLQNVVDADADITLQDRVDALIHLASYHAKQGTWDAAATTFEKAVVLDPDNVQLRQLASEAWSRSGNQVNSLRQLDLINTDSSLLGAIAEMEARFAFQLQLPPQQQNFRQVRDANAQLKRQLGKRLESQADPSGDSESSDAAEAELAILRSSLRYLEAFELMIPPENVAAETHLHSADLAHQIDDFAKQHPEEANLQALAAERLAHAKLEADAMAALDRLAKLDTRGGVSEPRARARTLSALGRNVEAAKMLIDAAQAEQGSTTPDVPNAAGVSLLQDAAVFASRGQDSPLAYQALTAIPDEQRSLQILSAICQLAGALPAGSELLTLDGAAVSSQDLYQHWFNTLKEREGTAGTYWRYLRASQLLNEVRQGSKSVAADDPKLVEARKLSEAIVTLRPRWGDAIALQGRISALAGDSETAVTQLRRGIASGSTSLATRQLLWQQLIALGRTEEAEQEIQIAEMNAGTQSDQFSASLIDLAIRQGDYSKSMEVAKESAKSQPGNINAQLVVAATGTTALANVIDESRRDDLIEQIRTAISLAAKLADTDDPRVLAANLRLAITLEDVEQIDSLIGEIEAGDLPEPAQNQLLSQAYLAKEDYEHALTLLLRADELAPTSNSQLRLAEIYRRLDRSRDEIRALRTALQRDQTNDRLRNLLAQKLVARSAEGQPVDWQAIGDLLAGSDGGGATSNQIMHAILLGSEAMRELNVDAESQAARLRLNQSKTILRDLVKKQSGDWKTPTRYLASLLQQEPDVSPNLAKPELARLNTEIRSLYQSLINDSTVEASDVYQYASYLLNQQESGDDATIKNLMQKLNSLAANSLQALEVAVRFADRQGTRDKMPGLVGDWANNALENALSADADASSNQDSLKELMVMAAAGNSLQKLGFNEDSVEWFERAYREFPTQALGPYIVALGQVDKLDEAVSVCAEHYAEHHDAQSATLLVEVLLNYRDSAEQTAKIRAHEDMLTDASERYQEDAGFLEGLGTLKMAEGSYDQAVKCFVSVLKVNPKSIRSLNNLAMSYAEIPERASEGLDPINSALLLTNQNPELLDTKGVVLMASGRLAEAESTFTEAYAASREPRHLFHVILAQINQNKETQAAKNWKDLDLEQLDPMGLTANERATLEKLKTKFASTS